MSEPSYVNGEASRARNSKADSIEDGWSFKEFLGQEVRLLRIAGLYSMSSVFTGDIKRTKDREGWPFAIGVIFFLFLSSCELFTIFQVVRDDPNYAIDILTAILSGIHSTIKGLRIFLWRRELHTLLRDFAVLWDELHLPMIFKDEIVQSAKNTYTVNKYYYCIIIATAVVYGGEPYIHLLQHHLFKMQMNASYDYSITIMPATYPFSTQTLIRYINCIVWEQIIIVYFVLWSGSTDGLFAQLTTHIAIHFQVLCHDLKSIVTAVDGTKTDDEKELIHRLAKIVKRHQDLHMYCKMIEAMFNPIIFVLMLLTAANMCCCVFRFEKEISKGNWGEAVKYLVTVAYFFVQVSIYCSYAETLTQQSDQVVNAAYNCPWVERHKKFKRLLLIIMLRSQKKFVCTAYGIFSANHNQISALINTAASYFTLLRSMA